MSKAVRVIARTLLGLLLIVLVIGGFALACTVIIAGVGAVPWPSSVETWAQTIFWSLLILFFVVAFAVGGYEVGDGAIKDFKEWRKNREWNRR